MKIYLSYSSYFTNYTDRMQAIAAQALKAAQTTTLELI